MMNFTELMEKSAVVVATEKKELSAITESQRQAIVKMANAKGLTVDNLDNMNYSQASNYINTLYKARTLKQSILIEKLASKLELNIKTNSLDFEQASLLIQVLNEKIKSSPMCESTKATIIDYNYCMEIPRLTTDATEEQAHEHIKQYSMQYAEFNRLRATEGQLKKLITLCNEMGYPMEENLIMGIHKEEASLWIKQLMKEKSYLNSLESIESITDEESRGNYYRADTDPDQQKGEEETIEEMASKLFCMLGQAPEDIDTMTENDLMELAKLYQEMNCKN